MCLEHQDFDRLGCSKSTYAIPLCLWRYKGGGVAFYIKQDLKFQILTDLMIMDEKIFESIFIAIQFQNNQVVCGNIYRSPQNNNKSFLQFTNHLEKTLITINKTKSKCYLHGDFNL